MRMFCLTENGYVVKVDVSLDETSQKKIMQSAYVLNTETSLFDAEYVFESHGDILTATASENPKDIFDRLSSTVSRIEKIETAFMTNMFLLEPEKYSNIDFTLQNGNSAKFVLE